MSNIRYDHRLQVGKNEFFDPADPAQKKLSGKMNEIYEFISKIGVDNFTVETFIEAYSEGFEGADFIYMQDTAKNNLDIGFLFSSYHKSTKPHLDFEARAFPAIAHKYRGLNDYSYQRAWLYLNILKFYIRKVLVPKASGVTLDALQVFAENPDFFGFSYIWGNLKNILKLENSQPSMQVVIDVEGPTTYADLLESGMNTNLKGLITDKEKNLLRPLDSKQMKLLKESSRLLGVWHHNPLIRKPAFFVNLSSKDKERHLSSFDANPGGAGLFQNRRQVRENNHIYRKHFIWTNPEYPEYAYQAVIDVSLANFWTFLKSAFKNGRISI